MDIGDVEDMGDVEPVQGGGWRRATARIKSASHVFSEAGEIRFFVGTYGPGLEARDFVIRDTTTGNIVFARNPGSIENNSEVKLAASKSANAPVRDGFRDYAVEVVFRGGERLAVWTQVPGANDEYAKKNLVISAGGQKGVIWGTWHSAQDVTPVSRMRLLDAMWDHSAFAKWTGISGLLLMVAGAVIWRFQPVVLFAGIASTYVFLVPPFQAPDEPDHFLTLTGDIGGPVGTDLEKSALRLANTGHFESIKFRPAVSFSAEDIGRPEESGWATHITPTGSHRLRSPLAGVLWPIAGRGVAGLKAADALVLLRFFNLALIVAAFAFFCALLAPLDSFYVPLSLLTIPALPFFGVHWSNHALPLAAAVAATGFVVRVISGLPLRPWHLFLWGFFSGLAFVAGVTGIATFAVMAGMAFAFLISGREIPIREQIRGALLFAGGALVVFGTIGSPEYLHEFTNRLVQLGHRPSAAGVTVSPWWLLPGFAALLVACLWAISRAQGALIWLAAAAWLLFLVASPLVNWPVLPGIEGGEIPGISVTKYGMLAVVSFLSGFGIVSGDPLVVTSFWGGFGWLDAYPPDWLMRLARLVPTAGISIILIAAVMNPRDRSLRSLVLWLTVVTALVCLAVAGLAFSTHRINVNLHGRYLAGVYVIFVAACGVGLSRGIAAFWRERGANAARQLLFLGVVLVHFVSWQSLILRYLGSS